MLVPVIAMKRQLGSLTVGLRISEGSLRILLEAVEKKD